MPKELGDVAVEFWLQNMHDRWREPSAAELPCAPAPQHGDALCDDFFQRQVEHARAAHGARRAVGDVAGKVPMGRVRTVRAARVGRQRSHDDGARAGPTQGTDWTR